MESGSTTSAISVITTLILSIMISIPTIVVKLVIICVRLTESV